MITKFSVSNFKGFNESFVFDLQKANAYEFNKESIKNGVVNHAIIYGRNGVGKSNLGLAMFDIIRHLTDNKIGKSHYSDYSNAFNTSPIADFKYEFLIDSNVIEYNYQKTESRTLISEQISINGKELAKIDRSVSNKADIRFKGAETLNRELTNENLSLLKYIKNNAQLESNKENETLSKFFHFVNRMLFFKTLDRNIYFGTDVSAKEVNKDIIERGNVKDLEQFLNIAGVECNLTISEYLKGKAIVFDFNGHTIPFFTVASTGTKSLVLFYFWLQRLREESTVSFAFIDEFDAFYHHELSALIVEELKKTGVQFVLTTHNTSIISNDLLRPDCYFLMNKNAIKSLAKSTPKELREAHNIEKMYKAHSFHV